MDNESNHFKWNSILKALYPLAVYVIAEECILTLLTWLTDMVRGGGSSLAVFCTEYAGNVAAVEMVLAMLSALLLVFRFFHPDGRLIADRTQSQHGKPGQTESPGKSGQFEQTGRSGKSGQSEKRGPRTAAFAAAVIGAAALGLSLNIFVLTIGLLQADTGASNATDTLYSVSFPVGIVIYGFITPYVEELLFRGILLKESCGFMTKTNAALLSAVLFGLYHGNLTQGLYGAVMGLVFAWGYLAFGELAAPYAMHALTNIVIFALSASGVYGSVSTISWLAASAGTAAILFYFAYTLVKDRGNVK